jgi:hypothetical protein
MNVAWEFVWGVHHYGRRGSFLRTAAMSVTHAEGTESLNPACSSEESANYRFRCVIRGETKPAGIGGPRIMAGVFA